jgi:hypothetical protein
VRIIVPRAKQGTAVTTTKAVSLIPPVLDRVGEIDDLGTGQAGLACGGVDLQIAAGQKRDRVPGVQTTNPFTAISRH